MKNIKLKSVLLSAAVAVALASCSSDDPDNNKKDEIDDPYAGLVTEKEAIQGNLMSFSLDMLKQLAEQSKSDENVACSPMSMSLAMAMMANGADGATRSQMLGMMLVPGADINDLNDVCRSMIVANSNVPGAVCNISNSLWLDKKFQTLPAFSDKLRSIYGAEVKQVDDLTSDAARREINDWVNGNSGGLLPNLLRENIADNTMALINSIYFAAYWKNAFDPADTRTASFTNYDGNVKEVDMMNRKAYKFSTYEYFKGNGFESLEMDLAEGLYKMLVILPESNVDMKQFMRNFTVADWSALIAGSTTCLANLQLPKFTVEYGGDMRPMLKALGMKHAFDSNKADFSQLTSTAGFFISLVQQRTKLIVDEEGVKAASATAVSTSGVSDDKYPTVDFVVNRPFAFMLYSAKDGSVLFNGYVNRL